MSDTTAEAEAEAPDVLEPLTPEQIEQLTPEQQDAARAALARAERPPEALGGPPADSAQHVGPEGHPGPQGPIAPVGEGEEFPTMERSGYAAELAARRHELGDDVEAVGDAYTEARDSILDGTADEADLETVQEWLLSDEAEVNTRKLRVRIGGPDDKPLIAPWYIRAIGIDVIRSAEREASGANRAQRRGQQVQYDELRANLRIVVEGTHTPDLKAVAQQKGLRDPAVLVERKFKYRPGVIAQIAGEIMALSGFDQEDVKAAGF